MKITQLIKILIKNLNIYNKVNEMSSNFILWKEIYEMGKITKEWKEGIIIFE